MLTYSQIGFFGRLGNQLFQFASTIGIAKKLGYEVCFPIENTIQPSIEHFKDGVTREVTFDIPKVFNVPKELLTSKQSIKYDKEVNEPHFHFSPQLFTIPDDTNLKGYYQTKKYFEHCEEEIRSILQFKSPIVEKAKEIFRGIKTETVSIHVRLGDYVAQQQFHPVCDFEYYADALKEFADDKEYTFVIFSDNIEHCKNIFPQQENVLFICDNEPEVDMCAMSMCDHNIIANSSFSWWAAWLNNNPSKKVVAPKKWFGEAYYYQNTEDLYCKNWIVK
mgnify:CR=1 FL=1